MVLDAGAIRDWAPVASQVVLVIVTVVYVVLTGRMVGEMRAAREAQATPALEVTVEQRRSGYGPIPFVQNVGGGVARNVQLTFRFDPSSEGKGWSARVPVMLPGSRFVANAGGDVGQGLGGSLPEDFTTECCLVAEGTYSGVIPGRTYSLKARVPVRAAFIASALTLFEERQDT